MWSNYSNALLPSKVTQWQPLDYLCIQHNRQTMIIIHLESKSNNLSSFSFVFGLN